jgi:ribose-phosphate pyrophosphokinase
VQGGGASHAVLSGNAVRNINASRISELIVTDSIEERPERKSDKIVVLPIGELMGKAIQNIHEEASITSLFI